MWAAATRAVEVPSGPLHVVDPSAGDGALIRAILAGETPASITAVELDGSLIGALQSTGVHVVHADALTLSRGDAPQSALGERFGANAPDATPLRLRETDWADVVIANPPYLRETGNRSTFEPLRRWNDGAWRGLYRKDVDLHHFFWELAIRWLRPGGVLVFLTPAYFLEAESAQPLRDLLLGEGRVIGIWRAGGDRVFPDAAVEAAVTVWRKGQRSSVTRVLRENLEPVDGPPVELRRGSPWWLSGSSGLAELSCLPQTIGQLYQVVEGVSAGANKLRRSDVEGVPGARAGEGILVLDERERRALGDEPFLRRRMRGPGRESQWIVMVRDGDLPRLDAGLPPETALERHLCRFRPILERRAEIRRNSRRSWYALAWPRPELNAVGAIVTPKWAPTASFAPLEPDAVPMTDYRVLIPRNSTVAGARDSVLSWLGGARVRPWFEHRMKRKGAMIEFYGRCLVEVPVPSEIAPE